MDSSIISGAPEMIDACLYTQATSVAGEFSGESVRRRTTGGEALRARDWTAGNKGEAFLRLLVVFLLFATFLAGSNWSWIDAQARAVVVLSAVLETPGVTPAVEV